MAFNKSDRTDSPVRRKGGMHRRKKDSEKDRNGYWRVSCGGRLRGGRI